MFMTDLAASGALAGLLAKPDTASAMAAAFWGSCRSAD
jgi:hypothetical protein